LTASGKRRIALGGERALMRDYLDLIDTATDGSRYDVTPLFGDYQAFSALVDDLVRMCATVAFDCVAGIDALGFILGTAIAMRTEKGFVPLRKGGKLPIRADTAYFVDYTGQRKSLEIRRDALQPGSRVLLVDEWVETGAQVKAAIELLERQGTTVAAIATINVDDNELTRSLRNGYRFVSVWDRD
jgi:adenine phosphoribosyltransferase